jgi:predicted nucleic acid-binding protein
MRVLFDTNVVLDVLLDREPHAEVAAQLMSLVDVGRLEGFVSSTTVTTIYYLAAKAAGPKAAKRHVRTLLDIFLIAPVDREVVENALDVEFDDFEDAVLHEAAVFAEATAIVTRNGKDFERASIAVFNPRELLAAVLAAE